MSDITVKKIFLHKLHNIVNPDFDKWFIKITLLFGIGLLGGGSFNIAGKIAFGATTTGDIQIDNQPDYKMVAIGIVLILFSAYFQNIRQAKGTDKSAKQKELHAAANSIPPNNELIQDLFYEINGFRASVDDISFLRHQTDSKGVIKDFKYARDVLSIKNNRFIKKNEKSDFKKIKAHTGKIYLVIAVISLLFLIAPYVVSFIASAFGSSIKLSINLFTLVGFIIALLDACLIPKLRRYSCADRLMNMRVKAVSKPVEIQEYQTITNTVEIES